jgi:16S rRNA C967 or C1407 C5-methylase (RsmB/RsmF family)
VPKCKYDDYVKPKLALIEAWARDGYIEEDIAKKLGVSRASLSEYKKTQPDLVNALKRGREVIDYEVENALLKSALGYEYYEETFETHWHDVKKEFVEVCVKRVKKTMPPSNTAQIFWLKNRKPKEWRDTKEIKHEGAIKLEEFFKE